MVVVNATFGQSVRFPGKSGGFKTETFVTSGHGYDLEWDKELDALVIKHEGSKESVAVFKTNISHITFKNKETKKTKE